MRVNNYAVLPASVRYDKNLSQGAKLLYAELSASVDFTGKVEPDIKYLAAVLVCDPRSVHRYIQQLVDTNHIIRDKKDVLLPNGFSQEKAPNVSSEGNSIHPEDEEFFNDFLTRFEKGLNTYLERRELYYNTLLERLGTFSKNEMMKALENRITFVNGSEWHQHPDNRMNAVDISLLIKDNQSLQKWLNMKSDKTPVELRPLSF